MQRLSKRSGPDRRSGQDQRQVYDIGYFRNGGKERRQLPERRTSSEVRKGWIRISQWSSMFLGRRGRAGNRDDMLGT